MKELRLVKDKDEKEVKLSDIDLNKHLIVHKHLGSTYFLTKSIRKEFKNNKFFWLKTSGCYFANGTFDSINEAIESVAPAQIKVYEL